MPCPSPTQRSENEDCPGVRGVDNPLQHPDSDANAESPAHGRWDRCTVPTAAPGVRRWRLRDGSRRACDAAAGGEGEGERKRRERGNSRHSTKGTVVAAWQRSSSVSVSVLGIPHQARAHAYPHKGRIRKLYFRIKSTADSSLVSPCWMPLNHQYPCLIGKAPLSMAGRLRALTCLSDK